MTQWTPVLLSRVTQPNSEKITTYLRCGGYEAVKALTISPEQVGSDWSGLHMAVVGFPG
jgi:hypothetical protein